MSRRAWLLVFALIPAVAAGGAEPSATEESAAGAPVPPPRPPLVERFQLFSLTPLPLPVLDLSGLPEEKRLFHQQGDPDSLFTLGDPTPEGQVHVKPAIEVNEIFLKAVPPDASQGLGETRPRAAGSFLPLDRSGRPYQLRLGARLVW
ncbi:MAG TPA: hypothetical protein VKS23_01115 [Thermoanaerobaculia bacterium]|nr:hypothetical protein [Thermoanaerobaculia bacterium]